MDLFRSKKRDQDFASLGEASDSLQKKHKGLSSSLDDLLEAGQEELPETASEISSSESDSECANRASKKQKIFAKRSVKWEKKKEKELRKKVEKNMISMDDFLRKQSEFKMWLYEEKSKNASSLTSPKLKTHFKQFVRLWNKRKLQPKYYRCSTLPDSPATPLTQSRHNFLNAEAPLAMTDLEGAEKEPTKSPLVTFGKTPPKLLKSKKLRLFSTQDEVALISVAPLCSPKPQHSNKENLQKTEECQYRVPHVQLQRASANKQKPDQESSAAVSIKGATPYKVSVFPWAVDDKTSQDESLGVCVTSTPPSGSLDSNWPPPPTESELSGTCTSTESPHKPPPPPPRIGSLKKSHRVVASSPVVGNYADPYDNVFVETGDGKNMCDYQEPVDTMAETISSRSIPDDPKLVLSSLISYVDEPDLSMYHKPIAEKRYSKEEIEEMYAKPVKRMKQPSAADNVTEDAKGAGESGLLSNKDGDDTSKGNENKPHSELLKEIMVQLDKNKTHTNCSLATRNEPDYAIIDDVLNIEDHKVESSDNGVETLSQYDGDVSSAPISISSELSKAKKKTVMAASSEKIYETYLSMGKSSSHFKNKLDMIKPFQDCAPTAGLEKRFKSQPDILSSSNSDMLMYERKDASSNSQYLQKPIMSTFKPSSELPTESQLQKPIMSTIKPSSLTTESENCSGMPCQADSGIFHMRKEASCDDISNQFGTPVIMATPSFESLCLPSPAAYRSGSYQSLTGKSGSSTDSASTQPSYRSTTTTSSLSFSPGEKSMSSQNLQSDDSVFEETPNEKRNGFDLSVVEESVEESNADIISNGLLPMTPGKLNAAKLGIDLSVYLLKPTKAIEQINNEREQTQCKDSNGNPVHVSKMQETKNSELQTNFETQLDESNFKTVTKDMLSGVKTKIDLPKVQAKKEVERRHTVQTVEEFQQKGTGHQNPNQVPNIGIAGKTRKHLAANQGGKSGGKKIALNEKATHVIGEGKDKYLETDLDLLIAQPERPPLQKSKSHSGFEFGSSNVVTDIW